MKATDGYGDKELEPAYESQRKHLQKIKLPLKSYVGWKRVAAQIRANADNEGVHIYSGSDHTWTNRWVHGGLVSTIPAAGKWFYGESC